MLQFFRKAFYFLKAESLSNLCSEDDPLKSKDVNNKIKITHTWYLLLKTSFILKLLVRCPCITLH